MCYVVFGRLPRLGLAAYLEGSILGPLLFILYVNDISDGCSSTVSSFADDVKIFRKIKSTSASDVLQNDLKLLEIWAKRWKMCFNVKKM